MMSLWSFSVQTPLLTHVLWLLPLCARSQRERRNTFNSETAKRQEPVLKLRGILRRGILAVAKAARTEHPRSGL